MKPWEAEALWFDEENEGHLARHGIAPVDVDDVWWDDPAYVPNRKGRASTWLMLGDTRNGRRLTIPVVLYEDRRLLRPVTGWDSTTAELTKWRQ